jgi:hypothetical protein
MSVEQLRRKPDIEDRMWEELVAWLVEKNFSPAFIRNACQEHADRIARQNDTHWFYGDGR